jgi:hypothetical protein
MSIIFFIGKSFVDGVSFHNNKITYFCKKYNVRRRLSVHSYRVDIIITPFHIDVYIEGVANIYVVTITYTTEHKINIKYKNLRIIDNDCTLI